ncbi:MAG: hypothetical protein HY381_02080 [Candidatus Chisholmbacteria bacterium]|nr:hypothetical protein [Candidatus Chisholmbacteria bacterium]
MTDIEVIPAILTDDMGVLKKRLAQVEDLVERVQIDVVDKTFADNSTLGVESLTEVETALLLDAQLMVQEPVRYVNRCDWVGVERVFGQVEQMSDQDEFVEQVLALGLQVGLALDVHTPVEAVEEHLGRVDAILLMAVEVGFAKQEFDEGVLKKIDQVRRGYPVIDICVDGGVNPETARWCIDRGANQLAVGSFLWEADDVGRAVEELLSLR